MKTCKYCKGTGISPTSEMYLCIFCDGTGKKTSIPDVFTRARRNPNYKYSVVVGQGKLKTGSN
jgi:DnaJ-class molecular chaperone